MSHSFDYDLFVIGAGSGGVAASRRAALHGAKVAICEDDRVGGTCVIRGCIPKKLYVYASEYADHFKDAIGYGWSSEMPQHDWTKLHAQKDIEIDRLNKVYISMLEKGGVQLIIGRGQIIDPHHVKVGEKTYSAEKILIATGASPELPDIPGKEHCVTSNELFEMSTIPHHVTIIGGGYIALEFASILRGVGRDVTLMIRKDKILRGFDEDLRMHLQNRMEAKGIKILKETKPLSIEKKGSGFIIETNNGPHETDLIMAATGRLPNTKGLGLDTIGVKLGSKNEILIGDHLQTNIPSIYAVGDVTDRLALTPIAIRQGRSFAEHFFNPKPKTIGLHYDLTPIAVFTTPPLSSCGLSEHKAKERGLTYKVLETEFRPMKNMLTGKLDKTYMKVLVDRESDIVLGIHMIGVDAPEIVQSLSIAMTCGATWHDFDMTMPLHPSAAEEFVTGGLHERKA